MLASLSGRLALLASSATARNSAAACVGALLDGGWRCSGSNSSNRACLHSSSASQTPREAEPGQPTHYTHPNVGGARAPSSRMHVARPPQPPLADGADGVSGWR